VDCWVDLFESPENEEIALKALQQQVVMTTTHISKEGFSYLVELMDIERGQGL